MCGRFTQASEPKAIAELFGLPIEAVPPYRPRYNLAPTQPALVLRRHPHSGEKELTFLTWGLVPSWAKDPGIGNRLINARAETLAQKPAFRAAFRRRRCLIPADGFYEWRQAGKSKQPVFITRKDGEPLALAGLWEHWEAPDGSVIESFAIITTEPNELVRPIHDRMPAILPEDAFALWLAPDADLADLQSLLQTPYPAALLHAWPVSSMVNSPANDDASLIEPLPMLFSPDDF
jgi:putative SOS response-associated peptidase YedK